MSQHLIDIFLFLWSTFHDALYVGLYVIYTKIRWPWTRKRAKSLEERIERIEEIHQIEE